MPAISREVMLQRRNPVTGRRAAISHITAYLVLFALIALLHPVFTQPALADEDRDIGRGMELLGDQRGRNPAISDIYDKLKGDLKPSVRDRLGKSDWHNRRVLTTDEQLNRAANGKSILIRGADGRVVSVGRGEMGRILDAGIRNATENPNWPDIYEKIKDEIGIDKIEEWAKKKGGAFGTAVMTALGGPWAAKKALGTRLIANQMTNEILDRLDKQSKKVREQIKQQLACNKAQGVVAAANAKLAGGDSVGAQTLLNTANTTNCPNAERARQNTQSAINTANKDAQRQAKQCADAKTKIASARAKAAAGDDVGAQTDLNSTAVRNCASTQADAAVVQNQVNRIRTCKTAKSTAAGQIAQARSEISAGQLSAAEATVNGIDDKNCPDVKADVAAVRTEISNEVARVNQQSADAMNSCDDAAIRSAATDLGRYTHPGLTPAPSALVNRASAISRSNAAFDTANAAYKAGDLPGARSQLVNLMSDMSSAGIQNCPKYTRASNGIGKIDRLTTLISQANTAAAQCNTAAIDSFITRFGGITHVAAQQVLPKLNAAKKRCSDVVANQGCVKTFGPTSYVITSTADGIETCGCKLPTVFNKERTRCVDPQAVTAMGDNTCRSKFGPDAYADYAASAYKTYVCRCGNGTRFSCGKRRCIPVDQFRTDLRRKATASCRRKYGRRLLRVKLGNACKFSCVAKKKPTRRRPRDRGRDRSRGHDPSVSAIVGIGVGVGIGIGNRRKRPPSRTRRRCHHQSATSRRHCGGG